MTVEMKSRAGRSGQVRPLERVLMLMALGLDPAMSYSDHQLQVAWRRRMPEVDPDKGGNPVVVAAAVNASYVTLLDREEIPKPAAFKV